MEVCGIIFKENGKNYYFNKNNIEININDYVIVETEKGEQFGKVAFIELESKETPQKNILRKASNEDYKKYLKSLKEAKEVLVEAKKMSDSLNLEMQFVEASFTFDHKQLIINFIADERIDFRELVKLLAAKYKARIDLHQIGVRDKAKEIGGLGPCGRPLCCNSFLNKLETITINMAKNQNIALNPSKINGSCGRLLCCLSYEDETYSCCKKELPSVGSQKEYNGKTYKVVSLNILKGTYTLQVDDELKEFKQDGTECC